MVELRQVVKHFGERKAVDRVSLAVPRGQFYSLLGPSGCGKTTTLRLIAGFEEPDEGEVLIHGRRVNELPPFRRNVSTVFQSYALFPHLTVAENVAFGLRRGKLSARRFDEGEIRRRVERMLELVQLPGAATRRPDLLSGGEKQRVALARSMVLEPDVLLLDEPLAALDQKLRQEMRLELKRLQRAVGISFLFVTHDQEEALTLSDQVAVMNQGRLEQIGTPEGIYSRPQTRFVARFIGSSNVFDGEVRRVEGGRVEIATAGGHCLVAPSPTPAPACGSAAGILVRPELVRIANEPAPAGAQRVAGKVIQSVFLGPHRQVIVQVEPRVEIKVLCPASTAPQQDSAVELWWNPEDALVLCG
ncbi:MAG: ABC transporter ATP-binding protein [Acidobacteria bacterium]|nr:ABC transporter ATP-binding protein [Acidobacteriota bacterium]